MDNKVKITKDLRFGFEDLTKTVDTSCEFTLRDVLTVCINSLISTDILSDILRCNYIDRYFEEMNSQPFKRGGNVDYLEVYWWGGKHIYDGQREDDSGWCFHGIGKLGHIPKDVLKYGKLSAKEKKEYRQAIAIEFSPMYTLADYKIKIGKKLIVTDYDVDVKKKDINSEIDFQPSITLIELLYAIFWELSFCGSPKQRDDKMDNLQKQIKEFKKAKKQGKLNKIYVSHEQVKKDILKKIKKREKENGL